MCFKTRLNRACHTVSSIPAQGRGRNAYIAQQMKVSHESVRKWFSGEAIPRPKSMTALAKLLKVEVSWLQLGVDHSQIQVHRGEAQKKDIGVFVLAHFLTSNDFHVAFTPSDPDASDITGIRDGVVKKFRAYTFADDNSSIDYSPTATSDIIHIACVITTDESGMHAEFIDLSLIKPTKSLTRQKLKNERVYKFDGS